MSKFIFLPNLSFTFVNNHFSNVYLLKSHLFVGKYDFKLFLYDVYNYLPIISIHTKVVRKLSSHMNKTFSKSSKFFWITFI